MAKPRSPQQQPPGRREPARPRSGAGAPNVPADKPKDDPSRAPESGDKPQSYVEDGERWSEAP
jgi:hypothetical protein